MVVVAVAVVIGTAAPIDDAPLYSSGRVARGRVAVAVECRAAGARRPYVNTGET